MPEAHLQPLESFHDLEVLVESISPLSPDDLDSVLKVKDFQIRSYQKRTLVDVWRDQQNQDRETRKYYAKWLLTRPINCSHFKRRRTAHVFHGNTFPRYEVAFGVYADSPVNF